MEVKCWKPCPQHLIQLSQWEHALQGSPEACKCQTDSCLLYRHPKCKMFSTVEVMVCHSGHFPISLGHFCCAAQAITFISCLTCTEAVLFSLAAFLTLCVLSFSVLCLFLPFPSLSSCCLSLFFPFLFLFLPFYWSTALEGLLLGTLPSMSLTHIAHGKSLPPPYLINASISPWIYLGR